MLLAGLSLLLAGCGVNNIPSYEESAKAQWSQVLNQENRIAVARRDYIEAVRQYNTELRTFPGVIWASTLYRRNKPMETFTVAEDVTRPPQVKF
jgi:hypothetical protein